MNIHPSTLRLRVPGITHPLAVEYVSAGSGPDLLLLHGLADSWETWERVIPVLARHYRVHAPSLPGFGASDKTPLPYSPELFATFVTAFLDNLGVGQTAVVGNSLGGLVGLRLALAQPRRVRSLVMVDSAGLSRKVHLLLRLMTLPGMGWLVPRWYRTALGSYQWAMTMASLLFAHPTRAYRPWVKHLRRLARTPGYLEATVVTTRAQMNLRGQRDEQILLDRLGELEMPVLTLWGERDRLVPVSHGRLAADRAPGGRLAILPDCGHAPQLECPEAFLAVVEKFLAGEEVPASLADSA